MLPPPTIPLTKLSKDTGGRELVHVGSNEVAHEACAAPMAVRNDASTSRGLVDGNTGIVLVGRNDVAKDCDDATADGGSLMFNASDDDILMLDV